jgi:hypothetical protein
VCERPRAGDRLPKAHGSSSGGYIVDPARPRLQDAVVQQTQVCNITEKSLNFGNTQCIWMGAVNAKAGLTLGAVPRRHLSVEVPDAEKVLPRGSHTDHRGREASIASF